MLEQIMLIFGAALAFALGVTPLVRRLAFHTNMVDQPGGRKAHTAPTPLLGGLAIYGAVIVALLLFGDHFYVNQVAGIVIGATLISTLGFWDDRVSLPPWAKLLGQTIPVIALVISGVSISLFPHPTLNIAATFIWVLFITNAVNFLDNMDGLSAGIAAVASAFFVLLASLSGQYLVSSLAAALLGACLGFLAYNFNPASIFMGDTGSLFLGFLLAAVAIKLRFPANIPTVTWMIPTLVLGVPILDTSLVIISHRLVYLGFTRRETVLTIYLIGGVFGMLAIFATQATPLEGAIIALAVVIACLAAIWRLERVPLPS